MCEVSYRYYKYLVSLSPNRNIFHFTNPYAITKLKLRTFVNPLFTVQRPQSILRLLVRDAIASAVIVLYNWSGVRVHHGSFTREPSRFIGQSLFRCLNFARRGRASPQQILRPRFRKIAWERVSAFERFPRVTREKLKAADARRQRLLIQWIFSPVERLRGCLLFLLACKL